MIPSPRHLVATAAVLLAIGGQAMAEPVSRFDKVYPPQQVLAIPGHSLTEGEFDRLADAIFPGTVQNVRFEPTLTILNGNVEGGRLRNFTMAFAKPMPRNFGSNTPDGRAGFARETMRYIRTHGGIRLVIMDDTCTADRPLLFEQVSKFVVMTGEGADLLEWMVGKGFVDVEPAEGYRRTPDKYIVAREMAKKAQAGGWGLMDARTQAEIRYVVNQRPSC